MGALSRVSRRVGPHDGVMSDLNIASVQHRVDPPPEPVPSDDEVHAAQRRIRLAAQLAAEMKPTGGRHRRDGS